MTAKPKRILVEKKHHGAMAYSHRFPDFSGHSNRICTTKKINDRVVTFRSIYNHVYIFSVLLQCLQFSLQFYPSNSYDCVSSAASLNRDIRSSIDC